MPRLTEEQKDRIRELYPLYKRGEITQKEIAERVGCSSTAVRYHTTIAENGINGFQSYTESVMVNTEHKQKNPSSKSLSRLVIEGLNELDMTGAELARRLGVSKQSVYKYAKGETMPTKDVLLRMCRTFGISYHELDEPLKKYYRSVA